MRAVNRESAASRGYDAAWRRLRKEVIAEHRERSMMAGMAADPLCALCGLPVSEDEIHADHIVPFSGVDDPLRLDKRNIRIVHKRCHMSHTARHSGGGGNWDR